jgi:hypothetical protein
MWNPKAFSLFLCTLPHRNSIKKITANSFFVLSSSFVLCLPFEYIRESKKFLIWSGRKILEKTFFRILYLDDIHLKFSFLEENEKLFSFTCLLLPSLHGIHAIFIVVPHCLGL